MVKSKYTAGLIFVHSTPTKTLTQRHRKAIRSHATKAGIPHRPTVELKSWISPGHGIESLRDASLEAASTPDAVSSMPSPRRIGSDFSGLQLPSGIDSHMITDLVKLIDFSKHGVYPYEICFDVHVVERGWFPYMISDICCLHSMMFSVRAFLDKQLGHLASFHYAQTLQLLQARLNDFNLTSAISDSTIMVIITLAAVAELTGDFEAVANHIRGLEKIVKLRGGVRMLNTHNNLQVKVCRADLAYALLSGHQPRFLKEEILWDCFIAQHGLKSCAHQHFDTNMRAFCEASLDTKLNNVLKDLHAFSCISNLAYQTTRKLSPETYNEIMSSILYRLTHLLFDGDPLQEAIRASLLSFSSTIFMQRFFVERQYDNLLSLCNTAIFRLYRSTDIDLPTPIELWMVMLSHINAHEALSSEDWRSVWLDRVIQRAGGDSWSRMHEILRSVVWVDFIHNQKGKKIFEAAMLRLQNPEHTRTSESL